MTSTFNFSALSSADLQQIIADSNVELLKKNFTEGNSIFSDKSCLLSRVEVRHHLMTEYGKNRNKTLIADGEQLNGGRHIGLKCKDCNTFKLNCSNLSKKGGWRLVEGNCNLEHDTLCISAYKPTTVHYTMY